MPIIKIQKKKNYTYALWKINETVNALLEELQPNREELNAIKKFNHENRKKQNITARLMLNSISGKKLILSYTKSGKPTCTYFNHISISHSNKYCMIIVSENPIGIDIQYAKSNILKLSSKFINKTEKKNMKKINCINELHFIWCAKEAIYKTLNIQNCSLKQNIYISSTEKGINTTGYYQNNNRKIDYNIYCQKIEDYFISIATNKL